MKKRELCGIYFRIKRNEQYENICFTDMTEEEQKEILNDLSPNAIRSLCLRLAQVVRILGDTFDLSAAEGEEK
ncbi:hypothetical protein [Phascolarctobacterium faecium]|uniref:hypothetical protein n=1 Tax=Phascolarctobacterium faecium TaxID=33025 RepID=UPI00206CC831|nr:MAG TPA: hypothetical protein [Caudoviricetes sp.]